MEGILVLILNEVANMLERRRTSQRISLRNLRDNTNPFTISRTKFVRNFRMPQSRALKLMNMLKEHDTLQYSVVPFHLKVLAALNFFATGSYQNPVGHHNAINMSQSSISRSIEYISNMVNENLHSFVKFPTNAAEAQEVINAFSNTYGIQNTIGCIDCTHIAIIAPPESDDVHPPRVYRNRKRFYSINVWAICDANLLFTYVNARHPGSCHDSAVWTTSPIKPHIRQLQMQSGCWILGGSGYPLEPWLMTPYHNPSEEYEEKFNALHIRTRNCIERAFGVLKSTFRCLLKHRTLHYHPKKASKIINTCFILYNFLHKEGFLPTEVEDDGSEFENMVFTNDERSNLFHRAVRVRANYAASLE